MVDLVTEFSPISTRIPDRQHLGSHLGRRPLASDSVMASLLAKRKNRLVESRGGEQSLNVEKYLDRLAKGVAPVVHDSSLSGFHGEAVGHGVGHAETPHNLSDVNALVKQLLKPSSIEVFT